MKRIASQVITLPVLVTNGHELAAGKSSEEIEELDAASINYARNTAIPILEDNILAPFSDNLKEIAFREALRQVGIKLDKGRALLREPYERNFDIEGRRFAVKVYPTSRTEYVPVFDSTNQFLDDIVADSRRDVQRTGVRKLDDGVYIRLDYFFEVMNKFVGENTTRFNKKDLNLKDPATDKSMPLDEKIDHMRVYFDPKRYKGESPDKAHDYYQATSLKARIDAFIKDAQHWLMGVHNVPAFFLTEQIEEYYELSDGRGVRYLFFPNQIVSHSKVYKGLFGMDTENIAASNGDLDIIKLLAFKSAYQYLRGGAGVVVINDKTDGDARKGRIRISRLAKDKPEYTRTYLLYRHDGALYVKIGDIKSAYGKLVQLHTSVPTELKIDFFPPIPAHLK